MIDFSNLEKYRENNRIEAKKATGGLPRSIWETTQPLSNPGNFRIEIDAAKSGGVSDPAMEPC